MNKVDAMEASDSREDDMGGLTSLPNIGDVLAVQLGATRTTDEQDAL
jgi:hypothetical protein